MHTQLLSLIYPRKAKDAKTDDRDRRAQFGKASLSLLDKQKPRDKTSLDLQIRRVARKCGSTNFNFW